MSEHLLEVRHLKKYFRLGKHKVLKAVDDVSFYLNEGETLGIVGESGCGKTTCGKTCIGMLDKTEGSVCYRGKEIHEMNKKEFFGFAGQVQMIFQDPYSSLDPHMRVYDIIAEGLRIHHLTTTKEQEKEQVYKLLKNVGMNIEYANRYVHEFSGGQRQRIGIARALALNPKVIFCDEPVSALDVSVQAQIINLLEKLKKERNLALLFVAHDLAVVQHISDRIGVMYLGTMVELGTTEQIMEKAVHPYTKALLSAIPIADPKEEKERQQILLKGDIPSPTEEIQGCRFAGRCPNAKECCMKKAPKIQEIEPGHFVACHLYTGGMENE